ncbi:hypothetical protein C1N80_06135 [Brachybacterium sp. SGAir0954]|uniref:hypothetical protein n=1 Tax=Brachybacterium sp. SGAir0954 TaxID=2571029 RepID=UPI0010CD1332|nr:hypothetical protein [Brachybacterium sp. SGAir0954]QCR53199.1 hypothetical protein C1N80_06135 [Brachybacterium sp. SGAir0954]
MALPTNAGTGLVTGRFIVGVADGDDADFEPDGIPAQGTVTFVASVPYVPDPTAAPDPTTILQVPIIAVLDEDGYLCTPDPLAPTYAGAQGIRLIATDDPDFSVVDWTWNVTYAFQPVNGVTPRIDAHAMALPSGSTVDLASVVRVPSTGGIGTEQAEALAAQAAASAAAAAAAAQEAAEILAEGIPGPEGPPNTLTVGTVSTSAPGAAAVATITGPAPTQTLSLTLPRGEPGPQGPSGDGGFDATVAWDAYVSAVS